LVALRGLAGTGKTTLIPALVKAFTDVGHTVHVGTPTHRAAMILRRKGVDAATIHHLALTPYFTAAYAEACAWLGTSVPVADGSACTHAAPGPHAPPALIVQRLIALGDGRRPESLYGLRGAYPAQKLLESVGIRGSDHLVGFGPKPKGHAVLIVDEASMVGQRLLGLCREVFAQIILVGDPGQLPPVQDAPSLGTVPGVTLRQVHRQAAGSPILQLAYAAREGFPFWARDLSPFAPQVQAFDRLPAEAFRTAPLIVWRNSTRVACTRKIRAALGYPPAELMVGEPLVCRASDPAARLGGFYNNAMFHVVKIGAERDAILVDEVSGEERQTAVHVEELDGANVAPEAVAFRFGYCLTAHTAQGGEWPCVAISMPDVRAYAGWQRRCGQPVGLERWAYTAITRAAEGVALLTRHDFA
jgi:exodeoxyribonuclease-5